MSEWEAVVWRSWDAGGEVAEVRRGEDRGQLVEWAEGEAARLGGRYEVAELGVVDRGPAAADVEAGRAGIAKARRALRGDR